MDEQKLKSGFWVRALVRQCAQVQVTATIARKGDEDAGAILIKFYGGRDHCRVYSQVRDGQGRLAWMSATGSDPVPEDVAEQAIAKTLKWDSDAWVLEIEDGGDHTLHLLSNILPG